MNLSLLFNIISINNNIKKFKERYTNISRVIMTPAELKMQPTIHLQNKPGHGRGEQPDLLCKCIGGFIFNSVGLIIVREIPCRYMM
jgi:hypothetical protein